jgi:hypothetical protein
MESTHKQNARHLGVLKQRVSIFFFLLFVWVLDSHATAYFFTANWELLLILVAGLLAGSCSAFASDDFDLGHITDADIACGILPCFMADD